MTKAQMLSFLVATGVGVGVTVAYKAAGEMASASGVYTHALRIQTGAGALLKDGTRADRITAFQTQVTPDSDGGVELTDVGAVDCTASTQALRDWASKCQGSVEIGNEKEGVKVEVFPIEDVHVLAIEAGPDSKSISLKVFGANGNAACVMEKSAEVADFIASIKCTQPKVRVWTRPL